MPEPTETGDPHRTLRVRYYPRRVQRPAAPTPLTPSQALHLVDDPARADRARRTAGARDLERRAVGAGDLEPTPPTRPGAFRRLLNRLRSR